MQHQIAVAVTKDFNPTGVEPELLGNANRLAVAVHEYATDRARHEITFVHTLMCVF